MANAKKNFGSGWSNERVFVKLSYDFDLDGGAFADTYLLGVVKSKMLVTEAVVMVEDAVLSGGLAVVNVGISGGDVDAFLDNTNGAKANLVDDAVFEQSAANPLVLADEAVIQMTVATADLTAGKVVVYLSGYNAL